MRVCTERTYEENERKDGVCVCVCWCVSEKERERERETIMVYIAKLKERKSEIKVR